MFFYILLISLVSYSNCQSSGCGDDSLHYASSQVDFIESPGYGNTEYPEDLKCTWKIQAPPGEQVNIWFEDPFHLEAGVSGICYDSLTVYRGESTSSGVLAELCGSEVPSPMKAEQSTFAVVFETDYEFHYEGFRMYFVTEGNTTTPDISTTTERQTTEGKCSGQFTCANGDCVDLSRTTAQFKQTKESVIKYIHKNYVSRCDGTEDCSDGSDEMNCAEGDCGNPVIPPQTNIGGDRIINGQEAVPHSFPWQVSIKGNDMEHYCGGSVLNENWVMTAAHCAEIVFIGTYNGDVVVVGQHDRNDASETDKQTIMIEEKYIHPNYDTPDRANDIALLKLREPIKMGPTISPPCIPTQNDFGDSSSFPAGMTCLLSGWGKVGEDEHYNGDMFGQPYRLRYTDLELVDDNTCKKIYLEEAGFDIQEMMQCAGGNGKTSCNGDSGGPLVCQKDNIWFQVGIVSFGPAPCDANYPAVYTRVAAFNDWIHQTMADNS